ncbi:hypothetical protein N9977_00030 [bacterium]|jgi:hypothetical protein|nr:hypothetical protein [bacterium]|tara:strand:- start:597 stop:869 length:273 start_codon:yes stop_codon:yes gene_type:complete
MKQLFTHEGEKAITASALVKLTTPSGKVGPRIYRVILDGTDADEINQKIADYVESLKPHYRTLHKVEPDIEWEIFCDGDCIGIGCIKPSI